MSFKRFWNWVRGRKPAPINVIVKPEPEVPKVKPPEPETPVLVPSPGIILDSQMDRWTAKALDIVQSFEGETPWANITGDFDDMGLTCGALGWTWHYGDQQRLVKEFVATFGEGLAYKLMPVTGRRYLELCYMAKGNSMSEIRSWSNGRSRVQEPHNRELKAFWQSEEMVSIQIKEAKRTMSKFALDNIHYFKKPTFKHFAWLFDTRVLNGSLKGVALHDNFDGADVDAALDQMDGYNSGYNKVDAEKNVKLWESGKFMEPGEEDLFCLGWERSKKCRREFVLTCMNRKGTLALGAGYVNGKLRYPYDEAGIDPHEELLQ